MGLSLRISCLTLLSLVIMFPNVNPAAAAVYGSSDDRKAVFIKESSEQGYIDVAQRRPQPISPKFNRAAKGPSAKGAFNRAARPKTLSPKFNRAVKGPSVKGGFNRVARPASARPAFNWAARGPRFLAKSGKRPVANDNKAGIRARFEKSAQRTAHKSPKVFKSRATSQFRASSSARTTPSQKVKNAVNDNKNSKGISSVSPGFKGAKPPGYLSKKFNNESWSLTKTFNRAAGNNGGGGGGGDHPGPHNKLKGPTFEWN